MASLYHLAPLLLLAACKPPPDTRNAMPDADPERGRALIEKVGCGACHVIPGIGWPEGQVGPSLEGFAQRSLIAGKLPNRPLELAYFVRNAPAAVSGTTMPAMPLTEKEARDVAAYLYEHSDR